VEEATEEGSVVEAEEEDSVGELQKKEPPTLSTRIRTKRRCATPTLD
jgi:hypothetical protein